MMSQPIWYPSYPSPHGTHYTYMDMCWNLPNLKPIWGVSNWDSSNRYHMEEVRLPNGVLIFGNHTLLLIFRSPIGIHLKYPYVNYPLRRLTFILILVSLIPEDMTEILPYVFILCFFKFSNPIKCKNFVIYEIRVMLAKSVRCNFPPVSV